jgi:hypothetical protein
MTAAEHAQRAEELLALAEAEGKGFGKAKGGIKEQTLAVEAGVHATLAVYLLQVER